MQKQKAVKQDKTITVQLANKVKGLKLLVKTYRLYETYLVSWLIDTKIFTWQKLTI